MYAGEVIPRTRATLGWKDLRTAARGAAGAARAPGPAVAEFEKRFAETFGFSQTVALSSVRSGLRWTLEALDLPRGSEILCTPITLASIVESVLDTGLTPVFVDVSATGFGPPLEELEKRCTARTRAVLLTHLWGLPADAAAVEEFCRRRGLVLIEDASQCLGARLDGRPVGSFGRVGLFSFSPTKTVNCFHGAMLASRDEDLVAGLRAHQRRLPPPGRWQLGAYVAAEAVLKGAFDPPLDRWVAAPAVSLAHRLGLRDFTRARKPSPPRRRRRVLARLEHAFGALQAEAGLATLAGHTAGQARRSRIAATYRRELPAHGLRLGEPVAGSEPGDWVSAAFHPRALELRRRLWRDWRIDTTTPSLDLCSRLFAPATPTPRAAGLLDQALYLPSHPSLSDAGVERVVDAVGRAIRSLL